MCLKSAGFKHILMFTCAWVSLNEWQMASLQIAVCRWLYNNCDCEWVVKWYEWFSQSLLCWIEYETSRSRMFLLETTNTEFGYIRWWLWHCKPELSSFLTWVDNADSLASPPLCQLPAVSNIHKMSRVKVYPWQCGHSPYTHGVRQGCLLLQLMALKSK